MSDKPMSADELAATLVDLSRMTLAETTAIIQQRDAQMRAETVNYARELVSRIADRAVLIRLSALENACDVINAGRCESEAGDGPDLARCVRDDGHEGLHRDATGAEWEDDEPAPKVAIIPALPIDPDADATVDALMAQAQGIAPKVCGTCEGGKCCNAGDMLAVCSDYNTPCSNCPDCKGSGRAKESTESEQGSSVEDKPGPTVFVPPVRGGRDQQGASSDAGNVAEPQSVPRSAPATDALPSPPSYEIGADYAMARAAVAKADTVTISQEKLGALEDLAAWVKREGLRPHDAPTKWHETVRSLNVLARLGGHREAASNTVTISRETLRNIGHLARAIQKRVCAYRTTHGDGHPCDCKFGHIGDPGSEFTGCAEARKIIWTLEAAESEAARDE